MNGWRDSNEQLGKSRIGLSRLASMPGRYALGTEETHPKGHADKNGPGEGLQPTGSSRWSRATTRPPRVTPSHEGHGCMKRWKPEDPRRSAPERA